MVLIRPRRGVARRPQAGLFVDSLECLVHSVPPMRLPVRLQVTGCPLSLRPECAGLDLTSRETDPTLRFGQCAVGTERPPVKHVRVKNSGPVDARLTWRLVREGAAKERRLAAVGLTPTGDEDRPVHVTVSYEEPAAYEPPFIITPSVLTVPARRRTVSLGERRSPFGLSLAAFWTARSYAPEATAALALAL